MSNLQRVVDRVSNLHWILMEGGSIRLGVGVYEVSNQLFNCGRWGDSPAMGCFGWMSSLYLVNYARKIIGLSSIPELTGLQFNYLP